MTSEIVYSVESHYFHDHSFAGQFTVRKDAETLRDLLNSTANVEAGSEYEVVEYPLNDQLPSMVRDRGWKVLTVSYNVDALNGTYSQPSVEESPREILSFCNTIFDPVSDDSIIYRNYLPFHTRYHDDVYDRLHFVVFVADEDAAVKHCNTVMEELQAAGLLLKPYRMSQLIVRARHNAGTLASHEEEMAEQRRTVQNVGHCNRTLLVRLRLTNPSIVDYFDEGMAGEYTVRVPDSVLDNIAAGTAIHAFYKNVSLHEDEAFEMDVFDLKYKSVLHGSDVVLLENERCRIDWIGFSKEY